MCPTSSPRDARSTDPGKHRSARERWSAPEPWGVVIKVVGWQEADNQARAAKAWWWWQWGKEPPQLFRGPDARGLAAISEFRESLPTATKPFDARLTSSAGERALSRRLTQSLLPPELLARLRSHHSTGAARVLLQLAPAPRYQALPWGQLWLDPEARPADQWFDRRLIEVVDLVFVPPPLNRERADIQLARFADRAVGSAIHVVDPWRANPLIATGELNEVTQALGIDEAALASSVVRLKNALTEVNQTCSRLFFLGHITFGHHQGEAALAFSSSERLSSFDLLRDPTQWAIPPRVALIGCASGTDLEFAEPFGLTTAMLEAGAELVTATSWNLPTDVAYTQVGHTGQPLRAAALAINAVHQLPGGPTPISGLGQWQREQLKLWRANHDLCHSPVVWGAFMNTYLPERRLQLGRPG